MLNLFRLMNFVNWITLIHYHVEVESIVLKYKYNVSCNEWNYMSTVNKNKHQISPQIKDRVNFLQLSTTFLKPRFSWNIAKVGGKHKSIKQSTFLTNATTKYIHKYSGYNIIANLFRLSILSVLIAFFLVSLEDN